MRQRVHMMQEVTGFARGPGIQVAAAFGGHQPKTVEEFRDRPVAVGAFVLTKAAPSSRVETACAKLCKMSVWVWKVLYVYRHEETLPANSSCIVRRDAPSYECHLHAPSTSTRWNCKVQPVGDLQAETTFLSTRRASRTPGTLETLSAAPSADHLGPQMHVPFTGLLRPEWVLGGGFLLTSARHVPSIVHTFLAQQFR